MVAAVLRKATVTGSHNLQGLMERAGFLADYTKKRFYIMELQMEEGT